MRLKNYCLTAFLFLIISSCLFGQAHRITGLVTDEQGDGLIGASILLTPGEYGAITDNNGGYIVNNIPSGNYTVKASFVGYTTKTIQINLNSNQELNFRLSQTVIESNEIIVEVNRAKDRETPVAFSNIEAKQIEQKIHGQDAPLLIKGTPGVFTYSTDGVGNGEAQVYVRGFSQNYVQVLINGIPTNDPESNSVYWSNWGSVSSNAASIQLQRGAGSSLYGAGSFGGSFNIVTKDAPANRFYGVNLSLGSPMNTLYGIRFNSGLIADQFSVSLNIDRKISEGSRVSGRYEGINYYTSLSYFPSDNQSLKLVLHGAPQVHGYSFSQHISYFKKYGYDANPANFLPVSVINQLPSNKSSNLLDNSRELKDDEFVNLAHNFFHKPQLELHYNIDLTKESQVNATIFHSIGRGGGSSINSAGTVYNVDRSGNLLIDKYGPDGYITDYNVADTLYLKNAFQRISYSLHQQSGIIANYNKQFEDVLDLTLGGEFRYWKADHPGHFTNLFGKNSITQSYAFRDSAGNISSSTFRRTVYQGDMDAPKEDVGTIFGWNMADEPTYRSQYRNYLGETPQFTLFTQGNWKYENLNVMGSIQYVWYNYKLTENMPSENAIGRQLKTGEISSLNLTDEGSRGDKFYMKELNSDGTVRNWYEFDLVRESRSRGFLQPKFGLNYNINNNVNVFANFAHVERFADLGVYYNQGRVNKDVEDEKSNQIELGTGFVNNWLNAKLNGYYMLWENKAARIQDLSKAGQPGYDRNGNRSELVGTSRHLGVEFEINTVLDELLPFKGLEARGSFTFMNNTWVDILDQVLTDPITGNRRAFSTSSLNAQGQVDTLFFDELKDQHVASGPQTMANIGLTYRFMDFFVNLEMNHYSRHYSLDGDTYQAVDGTWGVVNGKDVFDTKFDNIIPAANIFDAAVGYNFSYGIFKGLASVQVLNLFDTEYFASSDRFGLIPGLLRSFRFNLSLGIQ